jgi:protein ImuA
MTMTNPKHVQLAALRRQLMNETVLGPAPAVASLGVATIDATLPWRGLPCGVLHEVSGAAMDGAATGFCAMLLARLAGRTRSVLWVCPGDDLYGPGLAALGLPLDRLILVRTRKPAEILWTIEEALRCRGLGAVLGEIGDLPLAAGRRLQLAARKSGVTAVLLRPRGDSPVTTAVTRWRVVAAPGGAARHADMVARWRVDLVRCRGLLHGEEGHVERWLVEWDRAARRLGVVPDLRDRPSVPAPRRMAG